MTVRSIHFATNKYFQRAIPPTGNPAPDKRSFSISTWFKRSANTDAAIWSAGDKAALSFYSNTFRFTYLYHDQFRTTTTVTDTEWHHVLLAVDTTRIAQSERVRIYLDGVECSYDSSSVLPYQNKEMFYSPSTWYLGCFKGQSAFFNGLLDESYYIDGYQLTPGDVITGTPGYPKDFTGAYGGNGFLLTFDDASSIVSLGYDSSGNALNFAPVNITTADSSLDIPVLSFTANDLVVGSPELGSPTLQVFDLLADDLVVGSPDIESPNLTVIGINYFTAVDLTTSNPELGRPICLSFRDGSLGAGWNKSVNSKIGLDFVDSAGGWEAAILMDTAAAGPFEIWQSITKADSEQLFRVTFDVAPTVSGKFVEIGMSDDASEYASAIFNPRDGECLQRTSTLNFHLLAVEADPVRFGYYRFTVVAETNDATTLRAYLRLCDSSLSPTYTGSGVGSVLVGDPMLLASNDSRDFRWEIGDTSMRFFWTVHLSSLGLRWFRCSQSQLGVDYHLTILTAPDLDCVLHRWQPAQDQIVFDYSGLAVAGSGDPMAGTP